MITNEEKILTLSEERLNKVKKLSLTSHLKPMNHSTVLPWDNGVDLTMYPKNPEHLWVFGTPYYEQLSDEQKIEVAWLETGRDISMFIWLEQTLPVLYMGYITKFYDQLDETTSEYLMIFSKEEIVHTMTFKRFMKLAKLEQWEPPVGLYELLVDTLPSMTPAVGCLVTLLVEWVAESSAIYTSQGNNVEPMAKELFKAHHYDEARHIAFGRWIAESFFETAPADEIEKVRELTREVIPKLINLFTYNPELSKHTTFDFPILENEKDKIEEIWNSESNQRINSERFSEFYSWIDKLALR